MDNPLVIFVSPQFYPIVGGYERAAERLAVGLSRAGHSVCVLTERRNPSWPRVETRSGFHVRRWWCLCRPKVHILTSMIGMLVLLTTLARGARVWHVHQYGVHAAAAVALGRLTASAVVLKLTSSGANGIGAATGAMPVWGPLVKRLLLRADVVVATTEELAAEASAFGYPRDRIHVIGNAADTQAFTPGTATQRREARLALGIADRPTAIAVGRLVGAKNFAMLIRAWHRQASAGLLMWQLVIVGDGAERRALQALIDELGVVDSVRLIGPRTDLPLWYRAADLYVSSSDYEGLSNTLLEAMASGLPVVATAVSGTAALVGRTGAGIVVPVGDEEALAAALGTMARDHAEAAEMGRRARAAVEQNYSVEVVTQAHVRLYESLIARRQKRRA